VVAVFVVTADIAEVLCFDTFVIEYLQYCYFATIKVIYIS